MINTINIVISERERGLLYRDGRVVEYLRPGRHRRWAWRAQLEVEIADIVAGIDDPSQEVEAILPVEEVTVVEVPAYHVALVSRLDRPLRIVEPGRYALWIEAARLDVTLLDTAPLRSAIPPLYLPLAVGKIVQEVIVLPYERALVYADGALADLLEAGRYALSTVGRTIDVRRVDTREQALQVVGQELMTRDKVTLRLNLMLKYQVTDVVRAVQATESLHDALYAEVQLAARAEVAAADVDALLEGRTALAQRLVAVVRPRAEAWGVAVARLELKDIVLPGEMKALLNRVIEAEKRAAAQNILRREEVAATRSLANTARLLQNNPVLRRLKEMEGYREIADRIENLTVVVAPKDLQAQLRLGDA